MAYELFKNKAVQLVSPQLTIRDKTIALNAAAGDIVADVGLKFAHLLWDADARKLAVRPIAQQDPNAFRVSARKGKRGMTISAQSFLNHINWKSIDAVVLDTQWNEKERLLEAVLPANCVGKSDKRRFI